MKNKILLIIGLIILTSLTGCKGKEIKSDDEWNYTVVINEGSAFYLYNNRQRNRCKLYSH